MYYNGATRTMQSLRATTPPLYYKRPDVITNTISNNNNRYNSSSTNNNNIPNVTNTSVNGSNMTTANTKERNVLGAVPDNENFTYHDIKNRNVAKRNSLSRNNAVAQHFSHNHTTMQNVNTSNNYSNIADDVTNEYNGNIDKEEAVTTNNNNYYNYNLENKKASLMSLNRNSTMDSNTEMYSNASNALPSTAPSISSSAVSHKSLASYNSNNNISTKLFIQPFTSGNLPSTSRERYNYNTNNNNNNNIKSSISRSNYTNNISTTATSKNDNNNDDDNNRFSSDANVNYNTSSRADSGFANMRQGDLPYYNNYNIKQQQQQEQLPFYDKRNVYDMKTDQLTELEKESYALGMEEMHFKALLLQETQTQRQQEELQLNLSRGWAQLLEAEERYYSEPLPDRSEEIHTRECVCNDLEHYLHQLNDQLTQLMAERDNLHVVLTQKETLEMELTQMVTHLHNLANRQQVSRLKAEAWFELEQQRVKCGKRFVRELDRQLSAMIDTDAWNAADLTSLTQEGEIKARVPHILAQLIANNDIRVKKVEAVCLQSTNMNGNNNSNKSNNINWNNKTDKIANATSNNNNYNSSSYVHFAPNKYDNNQLLYNTNLTTTLDSSGGLTSSHLTETASLSDNTDLHNVNIDALTTTNLCGGPSFCIGLNDASSDDDDNNKKDDVKHSLGNRNANALGGRSVIFSLNNTSRSSNINYIKNKSSLQHKRAKVEVVNA